MDGWMRLNGVDVDCNTHTCWLTGFRKWNLGRWINRLEDKHFKRNRKKLDMNLLLYDYKSCTL